MTRTALLAMLLVSPLAADEPKKAPASHVELRLSDGSRINAALLDDAIPVQTPHGKLHIPLGEVRRIEFGSRLPESVQKQIEAAIADLGSSEMTKREAAGEALVKIGPRAYPAVLRACKSDNREQAISAKRLREKFADAFPETRLPQHDLDVVQTDDAKIAGRIENRGVRILTAQFGERTLQLSDIVSIKAGNAPSAEEKVAAEPDPGNLTALANNTGKSYHFTVTGNVGGSVYGTDVYTTDSSLATAAVHAGILKAGETGVVKVTIVEGQNSYQQTTRNGVTSYSWNAYPSSYKVSRVPKE